MSNNEIEQDDLDEDILSILDKIDALVSISNDTIQEEVTPKPLESIATDKLKAQGFGESQLEEISKGMQQNLATEVYAKKCYNWMQMYELRKGLIEHLDITLYNDPLYSARQMHEIRLGLLDGLDASSYAKLILSSTDMKNIRMALFANAYKDDPESFERIIEDRSFGVRVHISPDCMEAYVTLLDSVHRDAGEFDISHVLEDQGIVYGLIEENINRINEEMPVNEEICIAIGKHPQVGEPGRYELFFENSVEQGYTVPPDDEIDYSDVSIIDMVKPGKVLAKYHPADKNTDGITVTGITVHGIMGEDLPPLSGNGFSYDEETLTYTAAEDGYPSYDETTGILNIFQVYRIHGDITYYQSLEYDGTVHIMGSVHNMATIRAKGDIIVDGFVENAYIYSGQNIVIKGGVNGRNQGIIEADGAVRGKFFENAIVRAKGLIEANYFLNCNISTDDRLHACGKKARIIGGNIVATVGVEAVVIGNYLSNKTVFNVGDVSRIEKRIIDLGINREKVLDELQQLTMGSEKLTMLLGGEAVKKNALYQKTCLAISTKEKELDEIHQEITRLKTVEKRARKAYVKVHGSVQADVLFIINGVRKKTEKDSRKGLFLTREKHSNRRQPSL